MVAKYRGASETWDSAAPLRSPSRQSRIGRNGAFKIIRCGRGSRADSPRRIAGVVTASRGTLSIELDGMGGLGRHPHQPHRPNKGEGILSSKFHFDLPIIDK